jgi:hypothetical protein
MLLLPVRIGILIGHAASHRYSEMNVWCHYQEVHNLDTLQYENFKIYIRPVYTLLTQSECKYKVMVLLLLLSVNPSSKISHKAKTHKTKHNFPLLPLL